MVIKMLEKSLIEKKEKHFPKYLDSSKGVQRAKGARADVAPGSPFWRLVCSRAMPHKERIYKRIHVDVAKEAIPRLRFRRRYTTSFLRETACTIAKHLSPVNLSPSVSSADRSAPRSTRT